MKTIQFLLAFVLLSLVSRSQQLFTENFSYTSTQTLTSNNWTQLGTTATNPINVTSSGLSYGGYVLSNIGNAAALNSSGQIVYRDGLNNLSSGSVYTSFLINVSAAQISGDYFFSLLAQGSTSINTSFNRIFIKSASSGYYKLGISKLADAPVYGNDSFVIGTTVRIVTKYSFVSGSNNDSCVVWGFSSGIPSTEPSTSSAVANGSAFPDASTLGRYVLRQGTSTPTLVIDGIRSATNWIDLNTATNNLPPFVSAPTFGATSTNAATIGWTLPSSYNSTTMKTLVFIKPVSSISIGTPNISANYYLANTDFSLATSSYQNDANAKCVFNGDTNFVSVTGLNQGTNYFVLIYIVRNSDSVYSTPATINGATPSTAPGVLINLAFISTGQNSASINWVKPAGYNNLSNSMVIYVKPFSSITAGTPNANPSSITANSNFIGNGTRYQNDTFAHCVFKGDTNFVNITGLAASTTYYVLAYAINDADSNYSLPLTTNGTTNAPTPTAVTGLTFTASGSTTANISWVKNINYSNSLFTTIVFVKQSPPGITTGTPNANPNIYNANTLFPNGTSYQFDGLAHCVFKGDTNVVSITGLTAGTTYSVLVYVVRDSDSLYSTASNATGASGAAPPNSVTNATFTALSSTQASIAWTAPVGVPGTTNVLVFVKQGSVINLGTPTRAASFYTANPLSPFGTAFQNDAAAGCVYKAANPANVIIRGLNITATYYIVIYVVRTTDSSYSTPVVITGTTQPAGDVTGLTFGGTGTTSATISWTKPTGYANASYTTLVFVKQSLAITNSTTPTFSPIRYSADPSFAGSGSNQFQNDGSAWCVFKGDTNFVNVTALNNIAPYYVLVYVVRDGDSSYSPLGATTNGSVLSSPPPTPTDVSSIAVSGLSSTSIHVSWTKPTVYIPASYTTMVFVKQGVAVSAGTPTKPVTYYVANTIYGLGNGYQNDATARCVFKGDTNFVNVTGLNNTAPYYILIYIIRDIDSTYSPLGATGSGSTLAPPPPPPSITSANFVGITTTVAKVAWLKPTGYDNGTMTTLIFIKQGAAITAGTPTRTVSYYTANEASPFGTIYQNDAAAKCVFKGDTDFVYLTNLSNLLPYQILIYVVNDADSAYSITGGTASGRSLATNPAPPIDVTSVLFTGITTTGGLITWNRPTVYDKKLWTTLVYVKQASAVTAGTPTSSINKINANGFLGLGSSYQNDASAFCVFKGDTNFVNIGNISNGSIYYVLIYIVTDYDSIYSAPGATTSGSSLPTPPLPTYYTISQINHINVITGVPDSINARAGLRGVVYGFNLRPPGVEFLLRDQTGGITVSSATSNFGYTVAEGDSVEVRGSISSARGLLQISALDTLKLLGNGKQINTPILVSHLDEISENNLVKVNVIKFVTPPSGNVWPSNTTINCVRIGSTDSIAIRIPSSSSLVGQPIPSISAFTITGMGSQISKSTSAPFSFDGYILIPRGASDIIPVDVFSKYNLISPVSSSSILVQDTTAVNKFSWSRCNLNIGTDVVKYTFQFDTITGNFSNPKIVSLTGNSGTDTSFIITNAQFVNLVGMKYTPFIGKWRVVASASSVSPIVRNSDSTNFINVTIGAFAGIHESTQAAGISVYPNPSNGIINILSDKIIQNIIIIDMTGRVIKTDDILNTKLSIDGSEWKKGVYFLKINTENGQLVKRILMQ